MLDVGIEDQGTDATGGENAVPRLRLRVSDTGPCYDPASQERLFARVERGQQSEGDAHGGLGLGLAITQALVDAIGGEIHVSSVVATGSVFEVMLPLPHAQLSDEADARIEPSPSVTPPFAERGRPLRVLPVEDHPINRYVLATMLEAIGAETGILINGREAVDEARRSSFDIILMDLLMPDGRVGRDACDQASRSRTLQTVVRHHHVDRKRSAFTGRPPGAGGMQCIARQAGGVSKTHRDDHEGPSRKWRRSRSLARQPGSMTHSAQQFPPSQAASRLRAFLTLLMA